MQPIAQNPSLINPSFQGIEDVPTNTIPFQYLGIPITGKKKTHAKCWKLIESIEKMFSRWKGRCLSYGGRIQLLNWNIARQLSYWTYGTIFRASIIKKVQKITYRFIWDRRKPGILWSQMVVHSSLRRRED